MVVNQRKDCTCISDMMVLTAPTNNVSPQRWICVSEVHKIPCKSLLCTAKWVEKYQFWHVKSYFLRSRSSLSRCARFCTRDRFVWKIFPLKVLVLNKEKSQNLSGCEQHCPCREYLLLGFTAAIHNLSQTATIFNFIPHFLVLSSLPLNCRSSKLLAPRVSAHRKWKIIIKKNFNINQHSSLPWKD